MIPSGKGTDRARARSCGRPVGSAYAARDRDCTLIIRRDACNAGRPSVNGFFMDEVFPVFARVLTVDQALVLIAAGAAARVP